MSRRVPLGRKFHAEGATPTVVIATVLSVIRPAIYKTLTVLRTKTRQRIALCFLLPPLPEE